MKWLKYAIIALVVIVSVMAYQTSAAATEEAATPKAAIVVKPKKHWCVIYKTRAVPPREPMWVKRIVNRCKEQAIARDWAWQNQKFTRALRRAARRYGVSYQKLLNCSLSEGLERPGEPWKWNGRKIWTLRRSPTPQDVPPGSSGAFGPMQFMHSTFYGNLYRTHGAIPKKYRDWHSKVGQANVAAAMFRDGRSSEWAGDGCN